MSRIKIKLPTVATRDEAEALVGDIALLTLNQIRTTAKMDTEIARVRQQYEGSLAAIAEDLKTKTDTLRAWAEANPQEFPPKRKSIEFANGTIGFRTGTPAVVLLNRSWTWKKVIAEIKRWQLDVLGYIRTKPEVDKDYILAENRKAKDPTLHAEKVLKPLGMKITQDESFFVDPKVTPIEPRQVTSADLHLATT